MSTRPAPDHPAHIRPNDRIVFFGDSITEQQLYTNYTEAYLVSRYPGLNLTFFNAGWGGDTAGGGVQRLERDVLSCKPTLVTVCFGMNDGHYAPLTEAIRAEYNASMRELVRRLKAAKVRIILLTPGFSDDAVDQNLRTIKYNTRTLRAFADDILNLAKRERLPVFDMQALMTDVNRRARKARPNFAMTAEGVHPTPCGHLVMAFGLLTALGVPPYRREIHLDFSTGSVKASAGIKVTARRGEAGIRIQGSGDMVPFFVDEAARPVLPFVPFEETFNQLSLRVTGSRVKELSLRANFAHLSHVTSKRLATGINLMSVHSSRICVDLREATQVLRRTNDKTQIYFKLWRSVALDSPQATNGSYYDRAAHRLAIRAAEHNDRIRGKFIALASREINISVFDGPLPSESFDNDDFITAWSLSGPFPQPFDTDHLGGEAAFSASTPVLGDTWLHCTIDPSNLADCLTAIFGAREFCTCYAVAVLESSVDQRCELLLGSDDGIAAWLNGDLLENKLTVPRGVVPDSDRLPVRLRKGRNVLMLKISQYNGTWGFCARFSGLLRPVKGLRS